MKKCRLGLLGLTLTSVVALASANAADMYRAPQGVGGYKDGPAFVGVNWSGFYAGVNGGYGWNGNSFSTVPGLLGDLNPSGGFGGGQIGYNWQGVFGHPALVLGIEADFQGADISDSVSASVSNRQTTLTANAKSTLDWFGTVRGRVGYAFDRTLVYATGGFAYGQITDEVSASIINRVQAIGLGAKADTNSSGWVVGGGLEHKFNPAWSVKGEYQYINLGQDSEWAKANSKDFDFHTVRVGLNYHVGQSYEPLK